MLTLLLLIASSGQPLPDRAALLSALNPHLQAIERPFADYTPLVWLSGLINIRPAFLLIGYLAVSLILVGSGAVSHLFIAGFGSFYPAWMTVKGGERESKEWLVYWLVFCFSTVFVQQLRWAFFFLSWKSYNVARMLGYLLLFHPEIRGARTLYNSFIEPLKPAEQPAEQ